MHFSRITFVVGVLFLTFSTKVLAADRPIEFGETSTHFYQKVPYKACVGGSADLKKIIGASLSKYIETINAANTNSTPRSGLSEQRLKELKDQALKTKQYVDLANDYVAWLLKNYQSQYGLGTLLPDAFVLFGGGKLSMSLGVGLGTSLNLGAVVMPYCITKIDKETKAVTKTFTFEVDVIGWGGPTDYGVGVGGGARLHFGVGLIWNLTKDLDFYDPGQFHGYYYGQSRTFVWGYGWNHKVGGIKAASTNLLDFAYTSIAIEFGPGAEVSWHSNNYAIIPASQLLGMLGSSFSHSYENNRDNLRREIRDAVEEAMKTSGGNLPR